jgi:hypothetical protein
MNVAALIAWIVTALGGFYLLATWVSRGGLRQGQSGVTRLHPSLVFGHFLLAAAGLIVWIVFLIAGSKPLAWVAFIILVPVALLGFTMFARWLGVVRARVPVAAPASGPPSAVAEGGLVPAERHLPVPVVVGHGLLAAATLVLVLLAALGV